MTEEILLYEKGKIRVTWVKYDTVLIPNPYYKVYLDGIWIEDELVLNIEKDYGSIEKFLLSAIKPQLRNCRAEKTRFTNKILRLNESLTNALEKIESIEEVCGELEGILPERTRLMTENLLQSLYE